MKIEKLTENKIRIILKKDDFKDKDVNMQLLLNKSEDLQKFFLEILNQAQKQLDFCVDGYKLLIEGFSSDNEIYIFTITKYIDSTYIPPKKDLKTSKKKVITRRKNESNLSDFHIYSFNDFEDFCCFCNSINKIQSKLKKLYKYSVLYLYNDTYYLTLSNLNSSHEYFKDFYAYITEFGTRCYVSNIYESKLKEYGQIVIKKNALNIGVKYFSNK